MKYRFWGKVNNGKLELLEREKFTNVLYKFKGVIELTIGYAFTKRSEQQNRYYWGVVIKMINEEMGSIPDVTHNMLRQIFLKSGYDFKGKRYEYIRSTTDLSVKEFNEYIENVVIWAATELGLSIPSPNEIVY